MDGRFYGREIIDKPSCPFCGRLIDPPEELEIRMPMEMPVGRCECGSVYSCDETGHNLGSAMIESLVVACNGDSDLAFDLLPEDDYLEKRVENYDLVTHLIVHGGVYEGRNINGVLFFIRLHKDILEVTEEGTKRLLKAKLREPKEPTTGKKEKKSFTKRQIEAFVKEYQIDPILNIAKKDKRIIKDLQRLLYSVDTLTRCRTSEIMGRAFAIISKEDPGIISRRLQGLLTAVTDTAASSWGYIGAVGEIISHNPKQLAGYIPELYRLMKDRALLAEALNALGKIANKNPEPIMKNTLQFIPLLQDSNPEVRGFTVILLGNLGANGAKEDLTRLLDDSASIEVYLDGTLENRSIGQLAAEAIEKI